MATRTRVEYIDDLDGEPVDGDEGAQTVRFAFDGSEYEIDLRPTNADKFSEALAPFVGHARRLGRLSPVRGARQATNGHANGATRPDASQLAAVRSWAKGNGFTVSNRGRIAANIMDAYQAAGGGPVAAAG